MTEFKKGQRIPVTIGGDAVVMEKLGEGGQGIVYRVMYEGKEYALKWYFPKKIKYPDKFYNNLANNVSEGAPTSAFLWPQFLTKRVKGSFGYIMELRPSEYKDFSGFLLAKTRFSSVSAVVNAALNIVNGFRELHRCGFSYQDLNDGNFFVNPENGDVLICDNDNVAPYGESLGIAGKCRYMAPEVVLNKKRPDIHTDRFSLSVILFLLLVMNHPLEGKRTMSPCLTESLERKYFGSEPVFMFDERDDSNRPVRGVHVNAIRLWQVYPEFIRNAFSESFSKEVMTGKVARKTDNEWQKLFVRLRDCVIACPKCGNETFVFPERENVCINCSKSLTPLPYLKIGRNSVVLYPGKKLYKFHIDPDSDDFKQLAAEVLQNTKKTSIWGLRNHSEYIWTVPGEDGAIKQIANHEVLVIAPKTVNFGRITGEIII